MRSIRTARVRRRAVAAIAAAVLGAAALAAFAPSASAGVNLNIEVVKTVVGPVPAGTTFTAHWVCVPVEGTPGSGDITFNSSGTPGSGDPFTPTLAGLSPGTCTITETQSGNAANVVFACQSNDPEQVVCQTPTPTEVQFTYDGSGVPGGPTATVTITNAYLPPLTVAPNPVTAGQQATVSGAGCTKAVFGGSATTGGTVSGSIGFNPPIPFSGIQADSSGAWSFTFTVPANTPAGPYAVAAFCNDPVPYPVPASVTVTAAATTPTTTAPTAPTAAAPTAVIAAPRFTG